MSNINRVQIGHRLVGEGQPCYVVAEVGVNHNGDIALAEKCIEAAVEAGVDAVKFQHYRTSDFISSRLLTYTYSSQGREVTEPQWDMFKRYELAFEDVRKLHRTAEKLGVHFFSTPSSLECLEELLTLGVPAIKNGSDYLGHTPMIEAMAKSDVPTILSVGMADMPEIEEAVTSFRDAGGTKLVVLHCVSNYPAAPYTLNLRRIPTLAKALGCPIGFSDHSDGITAAITSVALGACMIEKHFTLDRGLPGPDHRFSSDPKEMSELVASIRTAEASLGNSEIVSNEVEAHARAEFRLSCVARRDLPAGHAVTAAEISYQRPGRGIKPKDAHLLLGRTLAKDLRAGHVFSEEDFA